MDEILTPEQWNELKVRISLQFPQLTDSDLMYYEALEEDMLRMIECILLKPKSLMQGLITGQYQFLSPIKQYWRYNRKNRIRQSNTQPLI